MFQNNANNTEPLPFDAAYKIFGADAAEDDPNLKEYFLETPTWQKVLSGQTQFVLGRKGSGKSAIFKMLKDSNMADTTVLPITPQKFALDVLNSFTSKYPASPFNKEIAYATAWKYSIMIDLLLSIENTTDNLKMGSEASVHNWLKKHVELDSDIITRTVAFLEKWMIEKVALSQLSLEIKTGNKRGPIVGHDIDETIPQVEKILKTQKFTIAIDNLDEGWINKEDSRSYLVGLILAAKELTRLNNLNVVIFMRTDMFKILETSYQHMDKFRQSIDYITWNAASLAQLINLRIKRYYNLKNVSNIESWNRLFPLKMENNFDTYKHIVERTFLRPREIIQFCRHTVDIASKYLHHKVIQKDIRMAETQYSEWKFNDLSGEYSAYYDNIDKLLECYRREKIDFDNNELESETKKAIEVSNFKSKDNDSNKITVSNIISLLYQMGFIRAIFYSGKNKIYKSSSTDPYLLCSTIHNWEIHPAFRSKIIIKKGY
ncbi:MAG: hypothetical protein GYA62_12815 [Bacteroidales bacterium]|nr:hypothetical protein [Bacteroidales bacterium]